MNLAKITFNKVKLNKLTQEITAEVSIETRGCNKPKTQTLRLGQCDTITLSCDGWDGFKDFLNADNLDNI